MSTSLIESLIEDKKELLKEWDLRFHTHSIDQMLELIKYEFINPDEAFAIGYMIGSSADKLVNHTTGTQWKFNKREVE